MRNRLPYVPTLALFAGAACAQTIPSHLRALSATTGDLGPGMPGMTFATVSIPCVDAQGNIAFPGRITGPGVTTANERGLWLGTTATPTTPQSNQLRVRRGDPAPGFTVGVYGDFDLPILTPSGRLVFSAGVDGISPNATVRGVWSDRTGPFAKAAEFTNYPYTAGNQFRSMFRFYAMDDGRVCVTAQDEANSAYPAQETLTAPPSRPAGAVFMVPTGPSSGQLWSLNNAVNNMVVSAAGQGVFSGTYRTASGQFGGGLWTITGGAVSEVALVGAPAPSSPGLLFCTFDAPAATNSAGDVAFTAALNLPGQPASTDALFCFHAGAITRVVGRGDPVPGRSGVTFRSPQCQAMNAAGTILFTAQTSASTNPELWRVTPTPENQISSIIAPGQTLPGIAGATISSVWPASINRHGQVVLKVILTGPGVTSASNSAVVCIGAHGQTEVVARTGVPLTIAPGVTRTPTAIDIMENSGGEDGRATPISDARLVAYRAVFSDGSYAVLTAAIPDCGSSDFNGDGDFGTDADIESFFACLAGNCCLACFGGGSDFNGDGDSGTDADIESFFRVLGGAPC